MTEDKRKMTTDAGRPVGDNQNSLTVGPRGPIVFEDFLLFEKMAHFNRERIPERVVHAKGSGAFGHFVCTSKEITKYTAAKLFSEVGKKTPTFIRFSTVGGEKGSADTERGPRGFSLKFYTKEDNWDMTGNNAPHSRSTKKSIQRGVRNCFRRCARANLLEPVTKVPRINPR